MRYYSYNEAQWNAAPDSTDTHRVVTVSEDEIRQTYYPYWYKEMCDTYGQESVDRYYSFEECLKDWIIINWAWKSE